MAAIMVFVCVFMSIDARSCNDYCAFLLESVLANVFDELVKIA